MVQNWLYQFLWHLAFSTSLCAQDAEGVYGRYISLNVVCHETSHQWLVIPGKEMPAAAPIVSHIGTPARSCAHLVVQQVPTALLILLPLDKVDTDIAPGNNDVNLLELLARQHWVVLPAPPFIIHLQQPLRAMWNLNNEICFAYIPFAISRQSCCASTRNMFLSSLERPFLPCSLPVCPYNPI